MNALLDWLTFIVVMLWGVFLVGLGLTSLFAPEQAKRFLLGFAQTAARHYLEMAGRMVVGGALLVQAPKLEFSLALTVLGWMLVVTTVALLIIPWQWHRRFADRTVPAATRHMALIGIAPILLGALVITLLIRRFL
ncbi:MAG: hypothetical protein AB7Q37_13950 [Pyrinomonadaceae bacterium]